MYLKGKTNRVCCSWVQVITFVELTYRQRFEEVGPEPASLTKKRALTRNTACAMNLGPHLLVNNCFGANSDGPVVS